MTIADADEMAAYFVHHMTMEQRRKLMAERPRLYARVFPTVDHAIILAAVDRGLKGGE